MNRRDAHGWTLIELLVVVAIILLLSATAVPVLARTVGAYRLQKGATWLASALREAQVQALRRGEYWRVIIDPDGSGFTLEWEEPPAPEDLCGGAWNPGKHDEFDAEDQLTIDMDAAAWPCLVFGPQGRPEWPVPTARHWTSTQVGGELSVLSDGVFVPEDHPPFISRPNDPGDTMVGWTTSVSAQVSIIFDLVKQRTLSRIVVGLYSNKVQKMFWPTSISLYGTNTEGADGTPESWLPIALTPENAQEVQAFLATRPLAPTVKHLTLELADQVEYRYVKLVMPLPPPLPRQVNSMLLHEISFGDPGFVVMSPYGRMRVLANSVTGRVTVEPVSP